jgi:hypothetical protein
VKTNGLKRPFGTIWVIFKKRLLFFVQLYGEKEESDSEVEREVKAKGDKVTLITKRIPKKKPRIEEAEEEEEGVEVMDTGLSLRDDEDLALMLLSK